MRGGVPVLSRPTRSPSLSFRVLDRPALEGASPILPPGELVWPMKRKPDRKVPVVSTTELARRGWLAPTSEEETAERGRPNFDNLESQLAVHLRYINLPGTFNRHNSTLRPD